MDQAWENSLRTTRWVTTVLRVAGTLDEDALDRLSGVLEMLAMTCDMVVVDLAAATITSPRAVANGLRRPAVALDQAGRCLLLRGAPPELEREVSRATIPAVSVAADTGPGCRPGQR